MFKVPTNNTNCLIRFIDFCIDMVLESELGVDGDPMIFDIFNMLQLSYTKNIMCKTIYIISDRAGGSCQ